MVSIANPIFIVSFILTLAIELIVAYVFFIAVKILPSKRLLLSVLGANIISLPLIWLAFQWMLGSNVPPVVAVFASEIIAVGIEGYAIYLLNKDALSPNSSLLLGVLMNFASLVIGGAILLAVFAPPQVQPLASQALTDDYILLKTEAEALRDSPTASCLRDGTLSGVFSRSAVLAQMVAEQSEHAIQLREQFQAGADLSVLEQMNTSVCERRELAIAGCRDACLRGFYSIAASKATCERVSHTVLRAECQGIYNSYYGHPGSQANLSESISCIATNKGRMEWEYCVNTIADFLAAANP
ncbi:hypothetical protein COX84_01665 [Candidatus Micrarchaeota archaeon CG_4_10_14_0_2_um_filter_49_7]|nr:MAG: hypothetical protein AUJ13_05600 [Candidatus Micrarchaeota archaeon CG1_02_49_24]PIU81230.1 MAG: hypothetical protein COS70_05175 [Candidatus Micrarchaeota archaeon CG06_land_8_20_14_3_00_50_6]PIZ98803.1 MAG: hypothetical protein COX84_01665 [Candidatus Micrarchaeota archaeon CG_4_10_14_0_2_um_filter_49_7]